MAVSKQITGMRGVYLVAAELSRLGFVVAPTSRGARGADLLVTDEACQRAYTVQVKTKTSGSSYWLVGKEAAANSSPTHVFVFVEVLPGETAGVSFFVVPSHYVAAHTWTEEYGDRPWYSFERKEAENYRDKWEVFQG